MVTEEFLAELGRVKDEFTWKLLPDAHAASERRSQARLRARAEHESPEAADLLLDPIGAVCYAATRQLYDHESWQEAANALELSLISAADLVAATNDCTWKNVEGRRVPDAYLMQLRRRLIETVGLQTT